MVKGSKKPFKKVASYVETALTRPRDELSRAQRTLQTVVDLSKHCARQLAKNRATQMAAALAYRTIFGLIPMAVLALIIFRAFVGMDEVQSDLQSKLYEYVGISSIELPKITEGIEGSGGGPGRASVPNIPQVKAGSVIESLVENISKINFKSIGAIGLLLLIWAAISLVVTVETFFNNIYNAPSGRPWHLRIPIYWSIITLGPFLLFVSLYVAGGIVSSFQDVQFLGPFMKALGSTTALASSWLLLLILYTLMPNAKVSVRSAVYGSFISACLWELGKWGFGLYVAKAVSFTKLYGSLGLIPLFLMWIYATWWIVLFGLEFTYSHQHIKNKKFEDADDYRTKSQAFDPKLYLSFFAFVMKNFKTGQVANEHELSRYLGMHLNEVLEISKNLEKKNWIHHLLATDDRLSGFSLAVPPDQIQIEDILIFARSLGPVPKNASGNRPGLKVFNRLEESEKQAVKNLTVESLG